MVRLKSFDTNWYPTGSCSSVEVFADPVEHMNYLQDFLGHTSVPFALLQAQLNFTSVCLMYVYVCICMY